MAWLNNVKSLLIYCLNLLFEFWTQIVDAFVYAKHKTYLIIYLILY